MQYEYYMMLTFMAVEMSFLSWKIRDILLILLQTQIIGILNNRLVEAV